MGDNEPTHRPSPPPGWYPHPKLVGTIRYWDGSAWTDNAAPMAPQQPHPPVGSSWTPNVLAIAAGILVAAFVLWMVSEYMAAERETDCALARADYVMGERDFIPSECEE